MNQRPHRNEITAVVLTMFCLLTLAGVVRGDDRAEAMITKGRFTGGVVVHVHGADASLLQSMPIEVQVIRSGISGQPLTLRFS